MDTQPASVQRQDGASATHVKPFLKWTGGKQWLSFLIRDSLAPYRSRHYIEPFLGGGSIFFALGPESATLSDSNADLIATYQAVRNNVDDVIEGLSQLRSNVTTFRRMRAQEPWRPVDRAVRFIYLNKTAFNGMYRVNQRGEFNVPFGSYPEVNVCQPERLRAASAALAGTSLRTAKYQTTLRDASRGDLVYLDPPYVTTHNNNGFVKWNAQLFSWKDQERLAKLAESLRKDGIVVIVSNAAHQSVIDLYPKFYVMKLKRHSLIGGGRELRRPVSEVLLCSFPLSI